MSGHLGVERVCETHRDVIIHFALIQALFPYYPLGVELLEYTAVARLRHYKERLFIGNTGGIGKAELREPDADFPVKVTLVINLVSCFW